MSASNNSFSNLRYLVQLQWQRFARRILILLTILSGLALITTALIYWNTNTRLMQEAQANATNQALAAADQLSDTFAGSMALAERLAADLGDGTLAHDDIAAELQGLLAANPSLDGITVAFDPNAFSPDYYLYLVYVWRGANGRIETQVGESRYDYSVPPSDDPGAAQTSWYYIPRNEGPAWTEPFMAAGAGRVLIEYGVPFFDPANPGGPPIGVVAVDYSLEGMRTLVTDLELGDTGYGIVYSKTGTYLTHPVPERVVTGNIFTDPTVDDPDFQEAARQAVAGESQAIERMYQGEPIWNYFTPIASTGWALVVQLAQSEFMLETGLLLRGQAALVLLAALFLFFLITVIARVDEVTRNRLWLASYAFLIIGLAAILAILVLARRVPDPLGSGVLVSSPTTLNRYLEGVTAEFENRNLPPPVTIPTGILVQAVDFPSPTTLTFTGFVWQRVPVLDGIELEAGFTFPQAIDEPEVIEEVYREERETETLVLWRVTAALRQTLDPVRYPLDQYDVNVRLLPLEFATNTLLVPDLDGYNVTMPSSMPGLEESLVLNAWQLKSSGFTFDEQQYGTNLGLAHRPTIDVPEMSFNMRMDRRFLGPFIAYFLPALVTSLMIFGFLLNEQKPDEPEEIVTALTYTAGLFFVIALLHSALRDSAAAIGVTYLEYFYLLLYVLTLLVAANSFLVIRYPNFWFVRVGGNLITKLLFWPVTVVVMLAATVILFVLSYPI